MTKEHLKDGHHPYQLMSEMMSGQKTTEEVVRFLEKHPVTEMSTYELNEYLRAIKDTAQVRIAAENHDKPIVDLSGTGGDKLHTANISTLASLMVAATGEVFVYKYGNRSASGVCGSMDVLEAVGVDIEKVPQSGGTESDVNFVPLFARAVYPGARHVAEARKEFGQFSVFNFLFPLARPIDGKFAFLMGVANAETIDMAAKVVSSSSSVSALLVAGEDKVDEISVSGNGRTQYALVNEGEVSRGVIDIQEVFGLQPIDLSLLQIQDKAGAVDIFLKTLDPSCSDERVDAVRLASMVNAAGALAMASYDNQKTLEDNLRRSFELIQTSFSEGTAIELLKKLKKPSLNGGRNNI